MCIGDIGSICKILPDKLCVDFDGRVVEYSKNQLGDLELAYAITIHKTQGSDYPADVLPILSGPRPLMNRNILYTAVTRGKKCVTIVGNKDTVREMIQNKSEQMRYYSLCRRLQQLEKELKNYFDLSSRVKEMHTEIFSLRGQLAQAAALQCSNKDCTQRAL